MLQRTSSRLTHARGFCFRPVSARTSRRSGPKILAQQTGRRWDSEAENAAQVRRLIRRDKKEFLGAEDILERFEAEFGDGSSTQADAATSSSSTATVDAAAASSSGEAGARSSLAAKAAAVAANKPATPAKFKGSAAASPFGGGASSPASPFGTPPSSSGRTKMEPEGLSPFVSPDPLVPEAKATFGSFISGITLTQIVIVVSFTTIIGLMVATFTFVYNVGAIKLAGVD